MDENTISQKSEEKEKQKSNRENEPKKKKSRTNKKSLAVENEKRRKSVQTLLKCDFLPAHIAEVLKQEELEAGRIHKLSEEEMGQMWEELKSFVPPSLNNLVAEDSVEADSELISAIVTLLMYTAVCHDVNENESFLQMAIVLNIAMANKNLNNRSVLNELCELSEFCCLKQLKLPGEFYLNTFNCLFDLTLNSEENSDKKSEIKRMWEMHSPLSRVNLQSATCEPIVNKLTRAIVSPAYLSCKEGRQFIAFAFTVDIKFIKKFHQTVKVFLSSCKRTQASAYGEVYYSAWVNSSSQVKQELEKHCIQNLMTHIFTFRRKAQEMCHTGQNVLTILSYLHQHRLTPHFSKTVTELYQPLLWRHLRSGNNVERCNAAEVFLDVYPLEKPGSGMAESMAFLNKQHGEMVDLLTDTCHVVRILAIKGICSKLCTSWETFSQEIIQVLMRNLLALASDGSKAVVRQTLWDSLCNLLLNPESAAYLARILPSLGDYIHDENEKVRKSFVGLLYNVKVMASPAPIKYWKIVPLSHLAARLELEGPEVGRSLSKLLMSSVYTPGVTTDQLLYRLLQLIGTNAQAARKLFMYSSKVLNCQDAVKIMLMILLNLRGYVKTKMAESNCEEEQDEQKEQREVMSKRKKKRRSQEPLKTISENEQDETGAEACEERLKDSSASETSVSKSNESSSSKGDDYSQPGVSHALIDIVSLLWAIHAATLAKPDNEADHENLLDYSCASIPLFLKYYKGTPTYFAVVHLSSLVPMSRLRPVSTVCSACVSHLKQISEMTPQREVEVIVHALCAWNRYTDIHDVIVDWLDQAFRCEGLNQSQAPVEDYKKRKVRFVAKGGKPMLALRVLDALFGHSLSQLRVMEKAYNQVHELYNYLERIKIVVERRLSSGLPLDSPMLSDEFIEGCLYRYSKLMILLHRREPQTSHSGSVVEPFDASNEFYHFIDWTMRVVTPLLPLRMEEEQDLSVKLVKDILRTGANLADLYIPQEKTTLIKLAELIKSLLSTECRLWFVEASLMVVKHMRDLAEALYGQDDQDDLLRKVLPCLLSQVLSSLSASKYSRDQILDNIQNLHEVKTVIFEVVHSLMMIYGPKYPLLFTVLKLFTDSLVNIIHHDIKMLQLVDTVEKVQELPFACGMLLSIVCKPPLASLWLATLPSSISLYAQDGNLLAAAVSLLHTLVRSNLPLPRPMLCEVLREAHTTVSGFTRESTQTTTDTSSTFNTETIDVKKVLLPILKDLSLFLECPLR